jgi:hypothetical protein
VGEILDQLEELELTEKTLVIVATDQGTRRDRLHKGLGYDEYHQVFCMMRFPSLTGGEGRSSTALTGMVDVFPTVLDICGVDSDRSLDGRSLVPLLAGKTTWTDERRLIVQCPRGRTRAKWENVSVKSQRWRLVNGKMLFDALNDPDQNDNVFDRYPAVVSSLAQTYDEFWTSLPSSDELLSRHVLGSDQNSEVRLNAMDWYKGDSPWHQLHMPKFEGNGKWAVEVARAGVYRFELRHYPREAPEALHATQAFVVVGDRRAEIKLDERETLAVIELPLESGSFDLETGFVPGEQSTREKPWGALFAYVQRIK